MSSHGSQTILAINWPLQSICRVKASTLSLSLSYLEMSMASVFLVLSLAIVMVGSVSSSKFDELFQPSWALNHFTYEGETLKMKLDNYSGNITHIFYFAINILYWVF